MIDGKTQERLFARLHASLLAFGQANGVAVKIVEGTDSISWWTDGQMADVSLRVKLGEEVSAKKE